MSGSRQCRRLVRGSDFLRDRKKWWRTKRQKAGRWTKKRPWTWDSQTDHHPGFPRTHLLHREMLPRVWSQFLPPHRDEPQENTYKSSSTKEPLKKYSLPWKRELLWMLWMLWMPWLHPFWWLSRKEGLKRDKRSGLLSTIPWKMSITNNQVAKTWCSITKTCPFPEKLQKCHPVMPAWLPHQGMPPSPTCLLVFLLYPCYHLRA